MPDFPTGRELVTISRAADMLGIHVNTAKRWAKRGDFPAFRVGKRGDWRVRPEDIAAYLEAHRAEPRVVLL